MRRELGHGDERNARHERRARQALATLRRDRLRSHRRGCCDGHERARPRQRTEERERGERAERRADQINRVGSLDGHRQLGHQPSDDTAPGRHRDRRRCDHDQHGRERRGVREKDQRNAQGDRRRDDEPQRQGDQPVSDPGREGFARAARSRRRQ